MAKIKDKVCNCELCSVFCSLPNHNHGRLCPNLQKYIFKDTKSCEDFKLTKFFYCTKRHIQISTDACNAIRITKRNKSDGKILPAKHYQDVFATCSESCQEGKLIESLFKPKSKLNRRTKTILKRRIK